MSNLNFLLVLNTYADSNPTNYPSQNNFKWTRVLNSFPVINPTSDSFSLSPGSSLTLLNGTRTLLQDNTTEYSIAPTGLSSTLYTFSWSGGTAPNFRTPRTTGANATTAINVTINGPLATFSSSPGAFASFTGTIAGTSTPVAVTATNLGTVGNSVVLAFDGTLTISAEITAWNTANPSNTVALTSGDGTQIPSSGTNIDLSGGATYTQLSLLSGGVIPGDSVIIGSNFNTLNQGQYTILSLSATSFTIASPIATAEGPIALGSGFASQLQIFSSAGVQVGDTIRITGGFSAITLGSYEITQVSANSLEFSSVNSLPTEGPITTQSISIYSDAKSLVYIECDQPCILTINGIATDAIEPFVSDSKTFPGVFLRKSTIYSLSVSNPGLNAANLFFASCE